MGAEAACQGWSGFAFYTLKTFVSESTIRRSINTSVPGSCMRVDRAASLAQNHSAAQVESTEQVHRSCGRAHLLCSLLYSTEMPALPLRLTSSPSSSESVATPARSRSPNPRLAGAGMTALCFPLATALIRAFACEAGGYPPSRSVDESVVSTSSKAAAVAAWLRRFAATLPVGVRLALRDISPSLSRAPDTAGPMSSWSA